LLTACEQAVNKPVWHMPWLHVQWKTPDDGQRNCPKHLEFYSKNKFEKWMHLFGFIIRIYHNARSPECQIHLMSQRQWQNYNNTCTCNNHFINFKYICNGKITSDSETPEETDGQKQQPSSASPITDVTSSFLPTTTLQNTSTPS
jgi:hypothetical protein